MTDNNVFHGLTALRALGEWLAPFYSPRVLARPRLKNGIICTNNCKQSVFNKQPYLTAVCK